MAHVFISYKHDDFEFAENVKHQVEKAGFKTWMDNERLRAGEDWREAIDLAIKSSFALVVIVTPEAKSSEYVTYEWSCAWGTGIKVIPLLLKTAELHPRLAALQYEDFTNRSRPWDRLIQRLREIETEYRGPSNTYVPPDAPLALRQAMDEAMRDLLQELNNEDTSRRIQTAQALGAFGDPIAIPKLLVALYDSVWSVRQAAARSLGQIGNPLAVSGLIPTLFERCV